MSNVLNGTIHQRSFIRLVSSHLSLFVPSKEVQTGPRNGEYLLFSLYVLLSEVPDYYFEIGIIQLTSNLVYTFVCWVWVMIWLRWPHVGLLVIFSSPLQIAKYWSFCSLHWWHTHICNHIQMLVCYCHNISLGIYCAYFSFLSFSSSYSVYQHGSWEC